MPSHAYAAGQRDDDTGRGGQTSPRFGAARPFARGRRVSKNIGAVGVDGLTDTSDDSRIYYHMEVVVEGQVEVTGGSIREDSKAAK